MSNETRSRSSQCPLCGNTPETGDPETFVWSGFCQCPICTTCSLELAIEFYDTESRLFTIAAGMLGLDIWECKKRYLIESIEKTRDQMHRETEKIILGFLGASIIRSTFQIAAIDRYRQETEQATTPKELAAAEKKLAEALSCDTSGLDAALPGIEKIDFI